MDSCNNEPQLIWREEWEQADKKNNMPEDVVTMNAIIGMANSIFSDLQFTRDLTRFNKNNRCPMLYFESWPPK